MKQPGARHPDLVAFLAANGVAAEAAVAMAFPSGEADPQSARPCVPLAAEVEGKLRVFFWPCPGLRALFRGDAQPPVSRDGVQRRYTPFIMNFEQQVLVYVEVAGRAPPDEHFEKAYALLRRLPDGRSQGELHDWLWRIAALTLAQYEMSAAEFAAVMGRLAISAATFRMGPASRNYIESIAEVYGDVGKEADENAPAGG